MDKYELVKELIEKGFTELNLEFPFVMESSVSYCELCEEEEAECNLVDEWDDSCVCDKVFCEYCGWQIVNEFRRVTNKKKNSKDKVND